MIFLVLLIERHVNILRFLISNIIKQKLLASKIYTGVRFTLELKMSAIYPIFIKVEKVKIAFISEFSSIQTEVTSWEGS